jgi:mRNA interferase MazF
MTRPSVTFEPYEVVKVPFPFADREARKNRPAVVLSSSGFGEATGHSVMAMITSAKHSAWSHDVRISDAKSAGLPVPCVIRMKLFTLDHRLVLARLGNLGTADSKALRSTVAELLADL